MEKKLIKPDLIIFDLDGTLIDSSGDIAAAVNHTLHDMGYPDATTGDIKANIGWGVRSLLEKVLPSCSKEGIDRAREIFLGYYGEGLLVKTVLYPGAAETIRYFHGIGKKLAIVTNKQTAFAERIIEGLGLSGYFSLLVGGDSLLNKKPHPEPVFSVLKRLGVLPEKAVFIGDSAIDMETGRRAGVVTIGAAYGFRGMDELKNAGCESIINSIDELEDLIG